MIAHDEEDCGAIDGRKSVEVDQLKYLGQRASYRLSVNALNRLAEILLGKERAATDWTFNDLYDAAADAKLAARDLAGAGGGE